MALGETEMLPARLTGYDSPWLDRMMQESALMWVGRHRRRLACTHLIYIGSRLTLVSKRSGRELHIHLPVGHQRLADCFVLFDHLLGRRIDPLKSTTVETINGQEAPDSLFIEVLCDRFDTTSETCAVSVCRRVAP
ncbi:hypothetical protein [Desulfosarcina sp.]|uniref:hypothetical protein n=1 Tax=Desulfosarcina sp. TaxID=2027861 RepID=UPI003563011D